MMPEEWPIAAPAADRTVDARAQRGARAGLATVRRDFFLDPAERLTEQERALMTAMLHASGRATSPTSSAPRCRRLGGRQ